MSNEVFLHHLPSVRNRWGSIEKSWFRHGICWGPLNKNMRNAKQEIIFRFNGFPLNEERLFCFCLVKVHQCGEGYFNGNSPYTPKKKKNISFSYKKRKKKKKKLNCSCEFIYSILCFLILILHVWDITQISMTAPVLHRGCCESHCA